MKKMKFIALAVAGAVALVGAGYAAWGNTITTTTTMETGKWSVVLENDSSSSYFAGDRVNTFKRTSPNYTTVTEGQAQYGSSYNNGAITPTGYDNVASLTNTGNPNYVYTLAPTPDNDNGQTACTFSFKNLHPGTEAMTRFEMRNNGTIPAKIDAVRVTFLDCNNNVIDPNLKDANNQVISAMKVSPFFQIHRGTGDIEIPVVNLPDVSLRNLQTELSNAMVGKVLKPTDAILSDELEASKDSGYPIFTFRLPADSLKADINKIDSANLGMNANFQVKIEFDFAQYNDVTNSDNTAVTPVPTVPAVPAVQ